MLKEGHVQILGKRYLFKVFKKPGIWLPKKTAFSDHYFVSVQAKQSQLQPESLPNAHKTNPSRIGKQSGNIRI